MVPKTTENVTAAARVLESLRRRISGGDYRAGQPLPAERALAAEFAVHRRVVRAAVKRLTEEGLLVSRPRCRPVIAGPRVADSPVRPAPIRRASAPGSPAAASRLVALVMWHGGFEQGATGQQRIFWGLTQELSQSGYHAIFLDPGGPDAQEIAGEDENAAREAASLRYARDHQFAGVVFYPYAYRSNRELIREMAAHLPLVMIDRMIPGIQTDFVGIDNYGAMRDATRQLLAQGHRRIVYATHAEPINTVQDRLAGYRHAMREAGCPEAVSLDDGINRWPLLGEAFRLTPEVRPTALLCMSDYVACRVADFLMAQGLRVPEDVALIGFDNIVQMLPGGVGLTTTAQPFEEIGAAAARAALARMRSPSSPLAHVELPTRFVSRGSHLTKLLQTA